MVPDFCMAQIADFRCQNAGWGAGVWAVQILDIRDQISDLPVKIAEVLPKCIADSR